MGVGICVAALIAGCGGAGDDGDPRAEYIAKADAVCLGQNEKIQEIGSADQVKKVIIPGLREEIRELRALTPPAPDAKQVNEFLASMRLMLARAEGNPHWVATSSQPFLRTELIAERYGFAECGHV